MTADRARRSTPLRFAAGDNAEGPNQVAIVRLLIESGADPQDNVLSRAATQGNVPVMEELLAQGGDPGAHSGGGTIMGPCESLNPDGLRFLLEHGADPNYRDRDGSALDMILNTYQHEHREECLELLVQAGASYTDGAEMDILRGRIDLLRARLAGDPRLVDAYSGFRQEGETGFGGFFGGAPLHRPTLLHICAEYGNLEAARVLIAAGADVNRRAQPDREGFGNQTPVFHAVASNHNRSFPVLRLLIENGTDLAVRANIRVPGPEGVSTPLRDVTPRQYAARYPNDYQPGPGSGPEKGWTPALTATSSNCWAEPPGRNRRGIRGRDRGRSLDHGIPNPLYRGRLSPWAQRAAKRPAVHHRIAGHVNDKAPALFIRRTR